jgi:hypothetical protein
VGWYNLSTDEQLMLFCELYGFSNNNIFYQAFITCSRKGDWKLSHKAEQNGLVQGHAYTITGQL